MRGFDFAPAPSRIVPGLFSVIMAESLAGFGKPGAAQAMRTGPSATGRTMKHLPNVLTGIRIMLTPIILILLYGNELPGMAVAWVLFHFAAASDWLDGKIARKFEARSRLGQALDPLADKVLVLGVFAMLCVIAPEHTPWWGVALIGLRDAAVTWLRSHSRRAGADAFTLPGAKRKTAVQIAYLNGMLTLLTFEKMGGWGAWARGILDTPLPLAAFLLVTAFTLWTGWVYFVRARRPGDGQNAART